MITGLIIWIDIVYYWIETKTFFYMNLMPIGINTDEEERRALDSIVDSIVFSC